MRVIYLNEPGSVRQETTMARAGTLPNFLYQREIDLTGDVHRSKDKDGYETCSSAEKEEIDEEDESQLKRFHLR